MFSGGDRGVSEIVGLVLLFGIVMAGATIILMYSSAFQQDFKEQNRLETARVAISEIDSRLEDISYNEDADLTGVGFPDTSEHGRVDVIADSSRVRFVLNGATGENNGCKAEVSLGSIRYTADEGSTVAYEAGGVWKRTNDYVEMSSPPSLEYRNGTIAFQVVNVTGNLTTTDELKARKVFERSRSITESFEESLLRPVSGCTPRTNLTISIQSPYHEAWSRYIEESFPDSVNVTDYDGNETVVVFLSEGDLAPFDSDGDGVPDERDNCPGKYNPGQNDEDDDGSPDACDPDDDGDGESDTLDNCPKVANPRQGDIDGDGVGNACEKFANPPDPDGDSVPARHDNCRLKVYNPNQTDLDDNGRGDRCDPDDDGDSVRDPWHARSGAPEDNCPQTYNPKQRNHDNRSNGTKTKRGNLCDPDDDGDGVDDGPDNCNWVPNAAQTDSDGDGRGDACESLLGKDKDGDGVDDGSDNCPSVPNAAQDDLDGQGRGDACDDDDDGDGEKDSPDNCERKFNPRQDDTDGNGRGDRCDPDDDGDGVTDGVDNCPWTVNSPQDDSDGDGRGDACDSNTLPGYNRTFVEVNSVDASDYRNVTVYAKVDTYPGNAGNLYAADFRVFENKGERTVLDAEFLGDGPLDVVFVVDDTGGMNPELDQLKSRAKTMVDNLETNGVDARYGLVSYKDDVELDQPLTSDPGKFKSAIDALQPKWGGDTRDDSLDALYNASQMSFRPDAQKIVVHVTKAPAGHNSHSKSEVIDAINASGAKLYSVTSSTSLKVKSIANTVSGNWTDLASVSNFDSVLSRVPSQLEDQYAITFESCLASDGSSRNLHVYANSSGTWGRGNGSYTAPNGNTTNNCAQNPPDAPSYPPYDPLPDPPLPPLTNATPTDTDETFPREWQITRCDRDDTETWKEHGGTPPDAVNVSDDDGDHEFVDARGNTRTDDVAARGCFPSREPQWPEPAQPEPYTNVINVKIDIVVFSAASE